MSAQADPLSPPREALSPWAPVSWAALVTVASVIRARHPGATPER